METTRSIIVEEFKRRSGLPPVTNGVGHNGLILLVPSRKDIPVQQGVRFLLGMILVARSSPWAQPLGGR